MSFRKILSLNHHFHTTAPLPPLNSSNFVSDPSKYAFGGGVFALAVSFVSYSVGPDKSQVKETTKMAACDIEDDAGKSFNSLEGCLDHISREKDKEMKQLKENETTKKGIIEVRPEEEREGGGGVWGEATKILVTDVHLLIFYLLSSLHLYLLFS